VKLTHNCFIIDRKVEDKRTFSQLEIGARNWAFSVSVGVPTKKRIIFWSIVLFKELARVENMGDATGGEA
jgi:hypothetical protein